MALTRSNVRGLPAVLLAATVAACGGSTGRTAPTAPQPASSTQGNLAAIARARADSAQRPYTTADIAFVSGMIHHHAQAIVMANWAPTHGASASVKTLAARIINAQQDEIAIMRFWLQDRNQPVPDATPTGMPTGMMMTMDGHQHQMLMPGMLTADQMRELDAAKGPEFDRRFLTFMIQHHRGAVSMVSDLFGTNGAAQDNTIFKLASDVNVDQTTEIARMEKMLLLLALEGHAQ